MSNIAFVPFQFKNEAQLKELIHKVGWNRAQIDGQVLSMKNLSTDDNGFVAVARLGNEILGYVSAQFYEWNKLGQIHGLVVSPNHRRKHIASRLIEHVEEFMKDKSARGVYVDTPVDNEGGIRFYESLAFKSAYVMPEYYDKDKDGVTYIKFFR